MAAVLYESTSARELNFTDVSFNDTQKADPSQCLVLKFEGVAPWNNPDSLVSAETEDLVYRLAYTVTLPVLFLIGGPANVINMAVFYKQGLRERINVCLFCLSLSDFLNLLFNIIYFGEETYLQFITKERYGPILRFMTNHNLLGFYGFFWVSEIISAIIASERCFCILQPLRSQTVLSTSTTTINIVVINIMMVGLYSVVATRYRIVCVFDPLTDSDDWIIVPSEFYHDHHQLVDFLDAYVFGTVIPVLTICIVIVTTIVTMVKLRQAAAWRAGTSSSSSVSAREMALTVLLVYNSIFFLVCTFPMALFRVVWLFTPEMNTGRSQHNMYFMIIWLLDILIYINSTFNIVVYYTMGSRYRQTFWQLMGRANKIRKMDEISSGTKNVQSSNL